MLKNQPIDTVSNRIKQAMELNGIRQVELVERTGLSKALVNHYVSGRVENAKTDKIYILAQALNVDPVWLMGMDVPMRSDANKYSIDNARLVAKIREDEAMTKALHRYFECDEDTKKRVVNVMNTLMDS